MSSPPPDYNPAASVLHGGTASIMPVMGGGGMSPSPDYNAGESMLAVGGTAPPITPVSGGGYTMEDDPSDVQPPVVSSLIAAPVQIEVYEAFEKDTIEEYRNQYIEKLRTNFGAQRENEWKNELKVLIAAYRLYYDDKWGPTPNLPKDASSMNPDKLFETIPKTVKTIIIFPSIDGNINTFLKTSQFLFTQGFFENNSASDLKFKKGICVIIYGNLFRIGNEDTISLLYLFLKMKLSNRDTFFLLRDPNEDKDIGLSFRNYELLSEDKPLLNFLNPSYVITETNIGLHDGIVFTNESIITKHEDMKSKGGETEEIYKKYYKLSRTINSVITPSAPPADNNSRNDSTPLANTYVASAPIANIPLANTYVASDPVVNTPVVSVPVVSVPVSNDAAASVPVVNTPVVSVPVASVPVANAPEIPAPSTNTPPANATTPPAVSSAPPTPPQAGGNPLCKSLIHLENENSLGTFTLEPNYLTFIRPGVRKSNPLICMDELGVQHSPFISGAFRSGEEDGQYLESTKKVKLLIDGKAYLIRMMSGSSNNALAQHLKLKDNWEKAIFSRGEAELLNDLQLSPELLYSVFGHDWKKTLAEFLDHVSNPDYMCYSNVSIIPSRLCDHTREFIQKVVEYRYKEELDKSIFKNISKGEPGTWPNEFTQLSVSEYKKHKMGVPFTEGDTTKINVLIVSTSGQSGLFQYEAKREIKAKLEELRVKYKDTYEILE